MRQPLADILAKMGPGTEIIIGAKPGAWDDINAAAAVGVAVASAAASADGPEQSARLIGVLDKLFGSAGRTSGSSGDPLTAHAAAYRSALGGMAPSLSKPGPLAFGRTAAVVAREIEDELNAGCVPSGMAGSPGRLDVTLTHPDSERRLGMTFCTSGADVGTTMRKVDGRVASFSIGRPAVRGPGVERDLPVAGLPWTPVPDHAIAHAI